ENTEAKTTIPSDQNLLLNKIGAAVNSMYRDAVGAVLSRDLKLASSIAPRFQEARKLLAQAEAGITKAPRPIANHIVGVLIALNRMSEICVDISDLTITR